MYIVHVTHLARVIIQIMKDTYMYIHVHVDLSYLIEMEWAEVHNTQYPGKYPVNKQTRHAIRLIKQPPLLLQHTLSASYTRTERLPHTEQTVTGGTPHVPTYSERKGKK